MNEKIEKAIVSLAEKAAGEPKAGDAMQFAQAAYNLANAGQSLAFAKTETAKT